MLDSIPFLRVPKHLAPEKHRDFAILTMVGVLGFSAHVVFLICFLIFGVYSMAYFNIASCFLFAVIFMANRQIDSNTSTLLTVAIGEIILHAICAVIIIGWDSNFHYYLFLAMMTSFLTGRFGMTSYISNGIAFFSYLALYFYTSNFAPLQEISETGVFTFGIMNLISAGIMVVTITAYFNYVASESARKFIASNAELSQQTEELKTQSEKLSKANTHTMDSIKYALRIQEAMLPSSKELTQILGNENYMVFYSPKDIISGDFFWCKEVKNKKIIALGDCTGHGVPGAMLTMIGESLLNSIIEKGITQPSLILDALQDYFSTLFISRNDVRDGMDISICTIDSNQNQLSFAGAKAPLTYIQNGKIKAIKGDRMSIGQTFTRKFIPRDFTNHQIDISIPTTFYMYSDGYQDQFGGKNNTKFYSKNLRKLLLEIYEQPMKKQRLVFKRTLFKWRNLNKQTDDVTILGFKINPNESQEKTKSIEEQIIENEYNDDKISDEIIQKQLEIRKILYEENYRS
ncbi:SpoIIE family protein phosphatase [Bernardetia sp. Wsw4-3y2]|uniref:PP2C family protein-serine/threonine phosphatase n=1 Tax=Bernardetia sp. Wsw4-3y2 TaxID=3127471 RepID=UPI0030D32A0A